MGEPELIIWIDGFPISSHIAAFCQGWYRRVPADLAFELQLVRDKALLAVDESIDFLVGYGPVDLDQPFSDGVLLLRSHSDIETQCRELAK